MGVMQGSATTRVSPLPAGVVVYGSPGALARAWPQIAPLQPVAWCDDGVLCCPRAAGDDAVHAWSTLTLPHQTRGEVPPWPPAPSAWIAGWYHRTPAHAAAPDGVRELVIDPGEGFGTHPHPTTVLCLEMLDRLTPGPAWDLGCGAGVLSQAWAALTGHRVDAVEIDHATAFQAERSVRCAGREQHVSVHRAPIEVLRPDLTGCVVLANLPPVAHRSIAGLLTGSPTDLLLSGFRVRDADAISDLYRHLGTGTVTDIERSGWCCRRITPPRATP